MPTNNSEHFLEEIKRLDFENKKYIQLLNDLGMNNVIQTEYKENTIFLQNMIYEKEMLISVQKKKLDEYKKQLEVTQYFIFLYVFFKFLFIRYYALEECLSINL